MSILSVLLIAAGLAADAFAVSVVKGISLKKSVFLQALRISFMFGLFQFLMPCIGFASGYRLVNIITAFSNLLAFFILTLIGGKMIYDTLSNVPLCDEKISFLSLILPAVATSIDALAVGVTMAAFENKILFNALIIGVCAFLFSFCGVFIGSKFGTKAEKYGELSGGIILILIGLKFLSSHFL